MKYKVHKLKILDEVEINKQNSIAFVAPLYSKGKWMCTLFLAYSLKRLKAELKKTGEMKEEIMRLKGETNLLRDQFHKVEQDLENAKNMTKSFQTAPTRCRKPARPEAWMIFSRS